MSADAERAAGHAEAGAPPLLWPARGRARLALLLILLLALAIRLALWSLPQHLPANDEVEYLAVARDLLAGRGWVFYDSYPWLRAPLYPLFLAGSLGLAGGDAQLASLGSILLSLGSVHLAFLLGQALAAPPRGRAATPAPLDPQAFQRRALRAGLLSALLSALLLTLATFANLWMAETLWSLLFGLALLLLLRWAARPRPALAAWAGVALGLASLTRSMPMLFVPAIALWMLAQLSLRKKQEARSKKQEPGVPSASTAEEHALSIPSTINDQRSTINVRLLLSPLIFVLAFLLTLSPWTLRNWLAYDAFIPVETGLAYNLWAFNQENPDLPAINAYLSSIRNPGERAAEAQRRGMELLRADPSILWRKAWPNTAALLRVKPIEDRFIQFNYYSDVSLPYLVAAFLLDDLLYLLIVLAALWGLAHAPADRRLALALLWVAYVVGVLALTHGEGRYRHFLYPVLIPYAGVALAGWRRRGAPAVGAARARRLGALALGALLALTILRLYPWSWAGTQLARAGWQVVADWRLARGDQPGALEAERRAAEADPRSSDAQIRFAQAQLRLGLLEEAIQAYDQAVLLHGDYYPATIPLGALQRSLGRLGHARFNFGKTNENPLALEWAWQNLSEPISRSLDLGDGLDTGYIRGFYPGEPYAGRSARWSRPEAQLRLAGGQAGLLLLRLAAPRPPGAPPAGVSLCLDQALCLPLAAGSGWRTYALPLPASAAERVLTLRATPYIPAEHDPANADRRELGALVDWVGLLPIK